jgi:hypothetical protein
LENFVKIFKILIGGGAEGSSSDASPAQSTDGEQRDGITEVVGEG